MPKIGIGSGINRRRGLVPFPATQLSAAGMYFDAREMARLYQTGDTSTPITAVGQSVGYLAWRGAAGIGLQATAGSRPTWNGDRITFDGTDDRLEGSGTPTLGLFQNVSKLFMAVRFKFNVLAAATIMSWGEGVTAAQPRFHVGINGASGVISASCRRADGDTTVSSNTSGVAVAGTEYVLMAMLDWTAQALNVYLSAGPGNETQIGAFTGIGTAGVTSNTSSLRQRLGSNANNANFVNGSLYKGIADAKLVTQAERDLYRQWMWQ